ERYTDDYKAAFQQIVDQKMKGLQVMTPAAAPEPRVMDLMAALKASVEATKQGKKPAARPAASKAAKVKVAAKASAARPAARRRGRRRRNPPRSSGPPTRRRPAPGPGGARPSTS